MLFTQKSTIPIPISALLLPILAASFLNLPQNAQVEAIPINQLRAIYPPISDAQLRTLLGYGDNEEPRLNGLLAFHEAPAFSEPAESSNGRSSAEATANLLVAKRKNAELVNHILKNFASINRLGDAGK